MNLPAFSCVAPMFSAPSAALPQRVARRHALRLAAFAALALLPAVPRLAAQTPTVTFSGAIRTLGSGFSFPEGAAVDGSGNVFVADSGNNAVKEIVAVNGVIPATNPTIRTLGSGFLTPNDVAVDASGNVFVADTSNNAVKEILAVNGSIPATPTVNTLGSGFSLPGAVAVDKSGNVFVADTFNNAVKEIVAVNGVIPATNPTIRTLGSGFGIPYGVAVDSFGNVFVADTLNNAVKEILAVNGSIPATNPTINTLGSGYIEPSGLAVDGSGNVFVVDTINNAVKEIVAVNGVIPATNPTIRTLGSGFSFPRGVVVDSFGNVFVADKDNSAIKEIVAGGNFGSANVGSASPIVLPLTFAMDTAGTLGSTAVLTQGATGLDFTDAGTGTCKANTAYAAGAVCTVNVVFTPKAPGPRSGAVELLDASGNLLASGSVQGIGVGPRVNFEPRSEIPLTSTSFQSPTGVARDASGNVYVADPVTPAVYEILAVNGSIPASPTIKTLSSGFTNPQDVAVDGSGNVYVADQIANTGVFEIEAVNGVIPANPTISTLGSGFGFPRAIAVDGSGNVYVADGNHHEVKEIVAVNGSIPATPTINVLGFGFSSPTGVAVDGSGNVFVADSVNNDVKEIVAVDGSIPAVNPTIRTLGSGFTQPANVAVDAQGNLYVTDLVADDVVEMLAVNGSVPAAPVMKPLAFGFISPQGVTVDSKGNVFVADPGNARVLELDYADPPSFTFPTPTTAFTLDSVDGAKTVTVVNGGNAPLTIPVLASGNNPRTTASFILNTGEASACPILLPSGTTPATLAPGAGCVLSVSFKPAVAGSIIGTLTLTDNALNAGAPGYAVQSIELSGTATKATPVITWATPAPITYGTKLSATQLNATANVAGTMVFSLAAGTVLLPGTHSVTATFTPTDTADYTTASASVILTVNKAMLSVLPGAATKVYGAPLPALTYTITGFVNGDTAASAVTGAAKLSTTATAGSPAGSYPITAAVGTLTAANYSFTFVSGTLTVTKAVLKVTANSLSKVYGAALPALTDTITGFVNADTLATAVKGAATLTTTGTAKSAVGSYPITAAVGTLTAANYSFTFVSGTLTVTKAALKVTANSLSKVYGAALPALTDTITGFVNADTLATAVKGAATLTTTGTANSAVGSYPITAAVGTLTAANYSFTFVSGTLTVTKAALKVTANSLSKVYGAALPALTDTITGFVNADTLATAVKGAATLTTTGTAKSAVGSYPITAAVGTLTAANYSFTFVSGTLTVTKAALKVTANSLSKVYGAALPALTDTITGFVNADTLATAVKGAATLTTTGTAKSAVGSYPITAAVGTLTAANYSFTFAPGTLTVTKAVLTVTAVNATVPYGKPLPALTYTEAGFVNGDTSAGATGALVETTTAKVGSLPGTYPITLALGTLVAPNYSFVLKPGTLTITSLGTTATPVFSPLGGAYLTGPTVSITDSTPGEAIYYTTNGVAPTTASTKYTVSIKVAATETIKAIAVAPGYTQSAVASATYTIAAKPSVTTEAATGITASAASLNGSVTANNATTQYWFAYGTTSTALTSTTAKTGALTGVAPTVVTAPLTGLKTKTAYYFQIVASNGDGTTTGTVLSFTTN